MTTIVYGSTHVGSRRATSKTYFATSLHSHLLFRNIVNTFLDLSYSLGLAVVDKEGVCLSLTTTWCHVLDWQRVSDDFKVQNAAVAL